MLTRCFVVEKAIKTKTTKFIFRIVETENNKKFENKKTNVVFNVENQQFRYNDIRAIYNNENYYEFSLKVLIIKLMKIQFENLVIQKVREQLTSKKHRKTCAKRN